MIFGTYMRIEFPYLVKDTDRHGNERIYFRYPGFKKKRIREAVGSPAFMECYRALMSEASLGKGTDLIPVPVKPASGTLGWLSAEYRASASFKALEPSTQRTRTRVLESMLSEPVFPGCEQKFAEFPLRRISLSSLEVLRNRKNGKPGAASDRVKAMRAMFKWAASDKRCDSNPAMGLRKLTLASAGHHTWTCEEIAQYEARHPPGTKAYLALQLLLFSGARRSDVVNLGRQHVQNSQLSWTAYKNRNRFPVTVQIPIMPPLRNALERCPTGDMVFLVTDFNKPFTSAGFGNWMKDRCREAGLPHCSSHGLRKAGATLAAEGGATAHQLMAMYGWRNLSEAERYTKAAERKVMAAAGVHCLLQGLKGNNSVPLSTAGIRGGTNRQKNSMKSKPKN